MDVGFIILCPDRNAGALKNSVGSIKYRCYNRECIAVVGNDAVAKDLKEMKEVCQTYKASNTITSLVNVGMKKCKHEWAFLMFAGSRVQKFLEKKLEVFAQEETDILFPVIDQKWTFIEGSFNGVLINTGFFAKVGDFPTNVMEKAGVNDFELAKMFWALDATNAGATFKAIIGMKTI